MPPLRQEDTVDMTNNITSRDIRSEAPSPRAFEAPNEPLRISPRLHGSILTSGSPTTRLRPVGPKMVVAEIKDFQGGEALESGRQSLAAKFLFPSEVPYTWMGRRGDNARCSRILCTRLAWRSWQDRTVLCTTQCREPDSAEKVPPSPA